MRTPRFSTCRGFQALALSVVVLLVQWPHGAVAQIQLGISAGAQPVVSVSGPASAAVEIQFTDTLLPPVHWSFLTNAMLSSPLQVSNLVLSSSGVRYFRAVQIPNVDMVVVPGGTFEMGDTFTEGYTEELPVHQVPLSPFYMAQTEVTWFQWTNVYAWAIGNGYGFDNAGEGKGPTHPVHTVNWYDVVKWCNARSQMENRTPVYYTSPGQTNVYRTGRLDISNDCVRWSADGYRLPTEAEWERAARGEEAGLRFPWGNTISHSNANYRSVTYLTNYDYGGGLGTHPDYSTGDPPYTSPVGSFPPNAYGLYDMAGNVSERCWDRLDSSWYSNPAAALMDTKGPDGAGMIRVRRGGSWDEDASLARCAGGRIYVVYPQPADAFWTIGFRYVITFTGFLFPADLRDAAMLPNGAFRFTIYNLTAGKTNIVETSTNLTGWVAIATNVPTTAVLHFTNSPSPSSSGWYYRSRQLP